MITEVLIILVSGLSLYFLVAVASEVIKSKLARGKAKKLYKNLPYDEDNVRLFGNHLLPYILHDNCLRFHRTHEKLGETVVILAHDRIILSTVDLDLIKQICIDNASKNINRMPLFAPFKEYEEDNILFAKDEQWRRIRNAFAPALKPSNVKTPNVLHEIESGIEKLIAALEVELDKAAELKGSDKIEINLDDVFHRYQMQVVLSCFYKQYDMINFDLSRPDAWTQTIEDGFLEFVNNRAVAWGLVVRAVRKIIEFVILHLHPVGKWRKGVFKFIDAQTRLGIAARKHLKELQATGDTSKIDTSNFILKYGSKFNRNIIDNIIDQYDMGKIRREEYRNTSAFLINAANKTVTDTLVFMFYQLAVNLDMQEKLRESIKKDGLDSEYLSWFIKEALRLNPPVSGGPSRITESPIKYKSGDTIPAGTFVVTPLFTIHRLKKYWGEDAEEFKPERWAKVDQHHPAQYMPFGAGLRVCLGKYFAEFEMRLFITSMLERYQFSCDKIKDDLYDFHAPILIFQVHKSPHIINIQRI